MQSTIYCGDSLTVLRTLPDSSVNCCITSPPYWGLRDYGVEGQLGLESTPGVYVAKMVEVFREVRRVLRDDGTLWLNLGDSYTSTGETGRNDGHGKGRTLGKTQKPRCERRLSTSHGLKPKDLVGIPWRVAFALQSDGWYLRQDIIWAKPNPMPESVRDRCTKAHEYVFLLSKSERYYFESQAMKEPAATFGRQGRTQPIQPKQMAIAESGFRNDAGLRDDFSRETRNRRSVWTVATKPYKGAHFATFPPKLIEPCILAGCPAGGTVLDPFAGSGTTGAVAKQYGREFVGIELNPEYIKLAEKRINEQQ